MLIEVNGLLFLIAAIAVILTPGQDMLLVITRSLVQGATAGIVTAAGISSGLFLQTILASLSIGVIVQTSELLFFLIKLVGAAYLVYLGISLLRADSTGILTPDSGSRSKLRLYFDGAFSTIANPKIAIFYFAFLPQFVVVDAENPTLSVFALGVSYAFLAFIIKGLVGYFSGQLSHWILQKPAALLAICRTSGITLIGLGVKLVLEEQR